MKLMWGLITEHISFSNSEEKQKSYISLNIKMAFRKRACSTLEELAT